jgi:hypothetical protein
LLQQKNNAKNQSGKEKDKKLCTLAPWRLCVKSFASGVRSTKMKKTTLWWIALLVLSIILFIPAKTTTAQTDDGTIIVNACYD